MIPNIRCFLPKTEEKNTPRKLHLPSDQADFKNDSKSPLVGLCPFVVLIGDKQLWSYTWAHRCVHALGGCLVKKGHRTCSMFHELQSCCGAGHGQTGPWLSRGIVPSQPQRQNLVALSRAC